MYLYIKYSVQGFYIEIEEKLNEAEYDNIGTTWDDFMDDKFVLLSDEQVQFKNDNPKAKIHEVWSMELDPVHVRNLEDAKREKLSELNRYFYEHLDDFKYNGTDVWVYKNERVNKSNEAELARNNGDTSYRISDNVIVSPSEALHLLDCMSLREMNCDKAVNEMKEKINALDDMESVDAVDVSVGFPSESNVNDNSFNENTEKQKENDVIYQAVSLLSKQINNMELSDEESYQYKLLYPKWEDFIGKELKMNMKVTYNNKLFKVIQPSINPVLEIYPPSKETASLYVEINETNKGTVDDPIPYNGNMRLELDKYYIENGIKYKCIRDSGIPVYDSLANLATEQRGKFVELVSD